MHISAAAVASVTVPPTLIERAASCDVLIGDFGSRRVKDSIVGTGYARCNIPTHHVLGDHVVCSWHLPRGAALPFTIEDMRRRRVA